MLFPMGKEHLSLQSSNTLNTPESTVMLHA